MTYRVRYRVACLLKQHSGLLILAVAIASGAGCALKETRTSTSAPRAFDLSKLNQPIQITPSTIVVDARSAFDYSTAHIPHSVPIAWADYTEAEPAQRGILQADLFGAARRLARAGIAPTSQVVVVGSGLAGGGEEGRVAWMLASLGVTDVQFTAIETLKPRLTNQPEATPPKGAPVWKPDPQPSLTATRDEVLFAINNQGVSKPISYLGQPPRLYRFIDVRSERAYLGKEGLGALKHVPNMDGINIPWKQFFTPSFRGNPATLTQLKAMGYSADQRLIVLDENGVASAAVTMILRASGFPQAANYAGGLQDLIR